MRFTRSHATHHVCAFVGVVTILLNIAGTGAAPPPAAIDQEGNSGSPNTNLVTVMTNNHAPIELFINTNGDLAYADLDEKIEVDEALALSDVNAKCFFWLRSQKAMFTRDFATTVFTATGTHELLMEQGGINFSGAERVYCYDGSRDSTDDTDTFTLFVEPDNEAKTKKVPASTPAEHTNPDRDQDQGQTVPELFRVKVGRYDDFAEMPVDISANLDAQLGNHRNVRVKLIDWPALGGSNYFDAVDPELHESAAPKREYDPGCYFLEVPGAGEEEQEEDKVPIPSAGVETGLGYFAVTDSSKSRTLSPVDGYDTVVCFRDHTNSRMRKNWMQARSSQQSQQQQLTQ